jgi:hypothetical protein
MGGRTMIKKYSAISFEDSLSTFVKPFSSTSNTFEIVANDGSKVTGYTHGADFPKDKESPARGEIFWMGVKTPKKGFGTILLRKALLLLKKYGAKTVNLSPVSESGRALYNKAIREGFVSEPIRKSDSGKVECEILI